MMLNVIGLKLQNFVTEPAIWKAGGKNKTTALIAVMNRQKGGSIATKYVKTLIIIKKIDGQRERKNTLNKKRSYLSPLAAVANHAELKIGASLKSTTLILRKNSDRLTACIQHQLGYLFGKKKWITFKYCAPTVTELKHGSSLGLDPEYFEIACDRIRKAYAQADLFVAPPSKPIEPQQPSFLDGDAA